MIQLSDLFTLTVQTIRSQRMRTVLTMLGIGIGTASVILLTSIGEGLRYFILEQYTQFGTNIMGIHPGKTSTMGIPAIATTTRKLTLEDASSLMRIPGVLKVMPVSFGSAKVEAGNRSRSVFIQGVTSDLPQVWQSPLAQGSFLPPGDISRGSPLAVLGSTLKAELFGAENALGKYIHIGGRRFQVIGVMATKGQMIGFDLNDLAFIPVAAAMKLFNKDAPNEIHVLFNPSEPVENVTRRVTKVLKERHDGEEDFTIVTQTEMLESLDNILSKITMAVAAIAAISLLVGSVGILTMMWISVNERISEIGLQKAIGAEPRQILLLFLAEAASFSILGGTIGVSTGIGLAQLLSLFIPSLPVKVPVMYVVLSVMVSVVVGLVSGILPARRAANLDPLESLRTE